MRLSHHPNRVGHFHGSSYLHSGIAETAGCVPAFSLVGDITLTTEQETPEKNGMIDVLATASGRWIYQFTAAAKLDMVKQIARATVSDAKAWFLKQTGVAIASISVSGPLFDLSGAGMLPDDLRAIAING